jgi:hypothetical protein
MIGKTKATILSLALAATFLPASLEAEETREQRVFPALVRVTASEQNRNGVPFSDSATGFVISKSGHLLTVHHVLTKLNDIKPDTLRFKLQLGPAIEDTDSSAIVLSDPIADLLVLKIPSPTNDRKALCFLPRSGDGDLLVNDTRIYSSGYPNGLPYLNVQGLIGAFDGPGNTWLTNLPIYPGQSGSPIYTASGQVMGIAKGEHGQLPGTYVFIPISNIRAQLANFLTDCPTPNVNIFVQGPQTIDISVAAASLPTLSECVFVGKKSAVASTRVEDAPFGRDVLAKIESATLGQPPIALITQATLNVQSNCPVLREAGVYYGLITRTVASGQRVTIGPIFKLDYAGDTFYWGQIAAAQTPAPSETDNKIKLLYAARDLCAGVIAKFANSPDPDAEISYEHGKFKVVRAKSSLTILENNVPVAEVGKFNYSDYNACTQTILQGAK